jgi:hypothetical protein
MQRSSTCRKAPHFALHKDIAIGFLNATGFRNKLKRTIFDIWCGDPRMTGGNFRLLTRLLTQIERALEVNELQLISIEIVEAARDSLVIGQA